MASSNKILHLRGFDYMLEDIARANGNIDSAVEKACRAGAAELETRLKAECNAANVPASVSVGIRVKFIRANSNLYKVQCGWEMGEYNPQNLNAGYKALFLNYGTPHRKKHGKIKARGFIARAKKGAGRKVKKAQADALNEILKGLSK